VKRVKEVVTFEKGDWLPWVKEVVIFEKKDWLPFCLDLIFVQGL